MNSRYTLLWGLIIFFAAGTLFFLSENRVISIFYVFISMLCGMFLIIYRKDIPAFSPIFMLISSVFLNIGFPALYLMTENLSFSEELLKNISVVYIIYFFSLIFPVFFANEMFVPSEDDNKNKFNILKLNFNEQNINFYLVLSNFILIFLIAFLLYKTGFSYTEALKNPLAFRLEASSGSLAYIRKLVFILFMLNTFLLSKCNFTLFASKINKLKIFTFLHIMLLLGFTVISGSRSFIFLPVVCSIAIYTFYNRIKLRALIKISVVFITVLTLMSFYSLYRNNSKICFNPQLISKQLDNLNIFDENVKRLDNFKNSLYFFEYIERENNTIFYFKDFHIVEQVKNHILQPFPRDTIEDKGYYFSTLMTSNVFGSNLSEIRATYNFGGISNAFWNLGIMGVILEGLMLGIAVVWLHRKFLRYINYDSFFMFFMTTFLFIPNSIIVDGFWNTMDGCGYFLELIVAAVAVTILGFKRRCEN